MNHYRIFDLHYHQLTHYPKSDCLCTKENGKWIKYSTKELIETANRLACGLIQKGIEPGDKVAIISTNNRSEWHITDLAILLIGAVNVPVYPTITPDDYKYIFNDSQCKLVFVSDKELLQKVTSIKNDVPSLIEIYSFTPMEGSVYWKELLINNAELLNEIEIRKEKIKETDLATLIYTSGTTGVPKGVMLSHQNLVSNAMASRERLPVNENAKALSFLPLCHVYERMVCYLYIYSGVSIYFAENMETIGDNLREVKPEIFTAVPRLLEKVYDKIVAKGTELTGIKKALFFWALNLGLKYELYGANGAWYELKLRIANKIIFNKWREALGGNVKAIASGAAALQPRLARVFLSANIPVMEGYGLTETSPVVAVNCEKNKGVMIGTVGRPLKNVQVKIADDGEILVKGPSVMMGYYNKPEATADVIDAERWLHTGDIGELVNGEFLKITDRKKEIFKTSGGKYIAPQVLENKLKESPFIEQIMVVGEGEKHPAAIIQPAFEYIKEWCKRKQITCQTNKEIAQHPKVMERIMQEVEKCNVDFAQYEKIKKIELTPTVWSIEGEELTPTLKLKRKNILKKYKNLYNNIYASN
ncbi:MAG: long-chain fatty acid--CoA ligase [Bacteroidetes bacterium]|nr:long-chain fatty acid--CoA ligase [Bacteroidota bacterium]MBV6462353.1 Long-chain-fatty-acid--CoA ligase FadD15 [Flavobacteriales bacterium]WKZ76330.1 MAG: AMP-dependent synthetase/ligase [Vicingaceae bacterium]MCL4817244.1 AMP-dependent synthetase/ligase [Flavobacteriales bacterium]NOG96197.1 long-chain fatty acid--CoA ligase [Bacteroidota bacterium]